MIHKLILDQKKTLDKLIYNWWKHLFMILTAWYPLQHLEMGRGFCGWRETWEHFEAATWCNTTWFTPHCPIHRGILMTALNCGNWTEGFWGRISGREEVLTLPYLWHNLSALATNFFFCPINLNPLQVARAAFQISPLKKRTEVTTDL